MGDFKDASLWMKLAFLFTMLGFAIDLFAFAAGMGGGGWNDVEACMVIGFMCFLVAVVLALGLVFLDELKGNKPALICLIIFALLAGLATIIGLALWGGNSKRWVSGTRVATYPSMLGAVAGLLAILAGIFAILEIAGVKSK